jgi:hypothetical protein
MSILVRLIGVSIVAVLGALVSATALAQEPAAGKPPLYERLGGPQRHQRGR